MIAPGCMDVGQADRTCRRHFAGRLCHHGDATFGDGMTVGAIGVRVESDHAGFRDLRAVLMIARRMRLYRPISASGNRIEYSTSQ